MGIAGTGSVLAVLTAMPHNSGGADSPDFSVTASPASLNLQQGSSEAVTITISSRNAFTGSVSLSVILSPGSGTSPSVSLSPTSVTLIANGEGNTILIVSTANTTSAITYTAMVEAVGNGFSHSISITVTVISSQSTSPDFSITATSPNSIQPGGSGESTITIGALKGFTGSVTLSATDPAGFSHSFSANPVRGGSGTSTLTINVATSETSGTYSVNVTGSTGTYSSHSTLVPVIVSQPPSGCTPGSACATSVDPLVTRVNQQNQTWTMSTIEITNRGSYNLSIYSYFYTRLDKSQLGSEQFIYGLLLRPGTTAFLTPSQHGTRVYGITVLWQAPPPPPQYTFQSQLNQSWAPIPLAQEYLVQPAPISYTSGSQLTLTGVYYIPGIPSLIIVVSSPTGNTQISGFTTYGGSSPRGNTTATILTVAPSTTLLNLPANSCPNIQGYQMNVYLNIVSPSLGTFSFGYLCQSPSSLTTLTILEPYAGTLPAEDLTLVSVSFSSGTNSTLYVKNLGTNAATLTEYIVTDSSGNSYSLSNWAGPTIASDSYSSVNVLIGSDCPNCTLSGNVFSFTAGSSYTVIVVTSYKNWWGYNSFSFTITR